MRLLLSQSVIIILVMFSCTKKTEYGDLRCYEKANPESELNKAIERNDLRFMAMRGYSEYVPGINDYYEKYTRYGYKVINGSSDVVKNYEHSRLMAIASNYAEKYNTLLQKHINAIESEIMSKALIGYKDVILLFNIKMTMTGLINMLPESFHANLISKNNQCVNRVWWFDPLKDGQPAYNWKDFLEVYKEINDVVCRHRWISEWIASGTGRSAEAQMFGIRPYTEIDYDRYVRTPWIETALKSLPVYEINLRDREEWVGTLYIGKDGKYAMITTCKPRGGKHWLDHQTVNYHPTQNRPSVIIVDQAGNWSRRYILRHSTALHAAEP